MNRSQERRRWVLALAVLWAAVPGWLFGPGGYAAWADTSPQCVWVKGADTLNWGGTYGPLGTAAAPYRPGARSNSVSWTDLSGALWLFGGSGYATSGSSGYLQDLWKYDPLSGNWAWMKGSSTANLPGTYGSREIPAEANTPGGRKQAVSWRDSSGALWLFGGSGYGAGGGVIGSLSDLWKYDPETGFWTWIRGSSTVNQWGVYTAKGPAGNLPGARRDAVSWIDASGMLWLFGGSGYDGAGSDGYLNDLWKYNPSTGAWSWMKGASTVGHSGTYGSAGVPAAGNTPGGREGAVSWMDPSGALWLFGGFGLDGKGDEGTLNDLWKYTPSTGNWTWMKGSNTRDHAGVYGTLGTAVLGNTPGTRFDPVSWTDSSGFLWLLGGFGYDKDASAGYLNDLWKYDRTTGYWTWMKGSSTYGPAGSYGTLGTLSPSNMPGGRHLAASWRDNADGLWLFGGYGLDGAGSGGYLNDLWQWPDVVSPTGTILVNNNRSVTNNANVTLSLTWADGIGSGVVRMKFSNDAVTWSAWESLAATKAWTLPAGEGYKTVRAMFRDSTGNNSVVYSDYIRVDTIPPTGSIIINNGDASTSNPVVSLGLTWSDGTGSGVTRMRFSIDGSHWSAWEPPVTPKSYTLPATPQYYTVRVQYLDGGNNYSSVYSDYIKLVAP